MRASTAARRQVQQTSEQQRCPDCERAKQDWMTVTQAAEHLGRSYYAVMQVLRLGRVPSYKPDKRRLVRRRCCDAYVEGHVFTGGGGTRPQGRRAASTGAER